MESFNLRLTGSNPSLLADDSHLTVLLGHAAAAHAGAQASFTLQHGSNAVWRLGDPGDGLLRMQAPGPVVMEFGGAEGGLRVAGPAAVLGRELTACNDARVAGSLVAGNLSVIGAATALDTFAVYGAATAYADLTVSGGLRTLGSAVVGGRADVMGALQAMGRVTGCNDLVVMGLSTLCNSVAITSNLGVQSDIAAACNLTVGGAVEVGEVGITHSGSNLGINMPQGMAPQFTLHVNGSLACSEQVLELSDRRVKAELQVVDRALERVGRITGYTFTRADAPEPEAGRRHLGVVAQEVHAAMPEAVRVAPDGRMSVAYGNLTALLIEAVKELDGVVRQQRAQLDALASALQVAGGGQPPRDAPPTKYLS